MMEKLKIGSKYEENKSMLVEKLNDRYNIGTLVFESVAVEHVCYFCGNKIDVGAKMFEVVDRQLDGIWGVGKSRYFVDENCMRIVREKDK